MRRFVIIEAISDDATMVNDEIESRSLRPRKNSFLAFAA